MTTDYIEEEEAPAAEDIAANEFEKLLPIFKYAIESMSNKSLRRVLSSIVEFPFNEGKISTVSAKEHEVFQLGLRLIDCKTVMISSFVKEEVFANKKEEENVRS